MAVDCGSARQRVSPIEVAQLARARRAFLISFDLRLFKRVSSSPALGSATPTTSMIEVTREMNAPRQRIQIPAEPGQDQRPPKKGSVPQRKTLSWDEIEDWQKDNEYILRGYRR